MNINYSYGHTVSASAGSSGEYSLLTIEATKTFILRKVTVHFPTGSGYYLQIAIMRGSEQVVPKSGYITGDNNQITILCEEKFPSDSVIKVWYNNTDAANAHSCYVLVEGELQ